MLSPSPGRHAYAASHFRRGLLFIAALAGMLASGCEHAFEPFIERKEAGFSIFGFLDVHADTQWIRLTPVRLSSLLGPEPVDAVVTLEHVESGRIVTLSDSLVGYREEHFGDAFEGVGYAHNFWTTERLEPLGSYRLTATRSDGAETTVAAKLPEALQLTLSNDVTVARGFVGALTVEADHILFAEMIHRDSSDMIRLVKPLREETKLGRTNRFRLELLPGLENGVASRAFVRVSSALPTWPYRADLYDVAVAVQGRATTNVMDGYGFVGGVATITVPYHICEVVVPRPDGVKNCVYAYDARSASLTGRLVQQPCGLPARFRGIRLIERLPNGGSTVRHWSTGGLGQFEFEGIEPGTELVLDVRSLDIHGVPVPDSAALHPLPRAIAGQGYRMSDVGVLEGC